MNRKIYTERKTFVRYDDSRYMVYLNEEVVNDYVPETGAGEHSPEPVTGYVYTGTEPDGGTLVVSADAGRDSLINGIIRSRYSQTEEDAVKTHQIELLRDGSLAKGAAYEEEWEAFNAFRKSAIAAVDGWLSED